MRRLRWVRFSCCLLTLLRPQLCTRLLRNGLYSSLPSIIYLPMLASSTLSAQWTYSTGAAGCAASQLWSLYDLSTQNTVVTSQPATTTVRTSDNTTVGTLTLNRLPLTAGDTYRICVVLTTSSGLTGQSCSLPFIVDSTAPFRYFALADRRCHSRVARLHCMATRLVGLQRLVQQLVRCREFDRELLILPWHTAARMRRQRWR